MQRVHNSLSLQSLLADLLPEQALDVAAAIRAADDELAARSQMFHLVAARDLVAAEVAVHRTMGTVVGQVLVEEAALELCAAAVDARYRVELALLRVTLTKQVSK